MISFKIKAASTDCSQESNDQQKDVTHGAEVKVHIFMCESSIYVYTFLCFLLQQLFHMYSKKYIAVRESEEDKEVGTLTSIYRYVHIYVCMYLYVHACS